MLRLILEDFDAKKIAESGQCFRMTCQDDHTVQVIAFGNVLTIYERGENVWDFSCTQKEFDTVWKEYFDLDTDYSGYRGLCLPEDAFLKERREKRRILLGTALLDIVVRAQLHRLRREKQRQQTAAPRHRAAQL